MLPVSKTTPMAVAGRELGNVASYTIAGTTVKLPLTIEIINNTRGGIESEIGERGYCGGGGGQFRAW